MSPLFGRGDKGVSAEDLTKHADALRAAVDAGGAELDPDQVARARAIATKVSERMGRSGSHTVVAFAGATGSGKSSLFNAVIGAEVAKPGARRPTTSTPTAAIWGDDPAGPLLDWLVVPNRHQVPDSEGSALDGLVLLDLPDFDSREAAHRAEAERVIGLADVFVWVTDPQKYADARLHDDYVAAMKNYGAVTIVVLNQADRLTPDQQRQCLADLERLLHRDGLSEVTVLATSARTGLGVPELRDKLSDAVSGARAARTRLDADVRSAATDLRAGVAATEADVQGPHRRELVSALSRAAGVPTVLEAVRRDYQRDAVAATGWPFTRWITKFRPDPLKRLRLDPKEREALTGEGRRALGRSSIPVANPAARAAVDLAARRLADAAGAGLPHRWAEAVSAAAQPSQDRLADELDQAVMATPLRSNRPIWWSLLSILQILLAIAVVVGLVWTLVEVFFGAQDLVDLPMWHVGPFGLPLVLLVGGLLLGWLLALLSRWFAGIGARRRAAGTGKRLDEAIGEVADRVIVAPVSDVLARHRQTRIQLETAAAGGKR